MFNYYNIINDANICPFFRADALQMYYATGKSNLPNDQFDRLKSDLSWEVFVDMEICIIFHFIKFLQIYDLLVFSLKGIGACNPE